MTSSWTGAFNSLIASHSLAVWLLIAGGVLFALVLVAALMRARRSIANVVLGTMALLAAGVAVAALVRTPNTTAPAGDGTIVGVTQISASLPALSCLDALAGESVERACEKALFGSPDMVAAAVSYSAAQISRLAALGPVAAADKIMTPELRGLRRAIERDRYGLIAHVLTTRDLCTLSNCAFFRSLTNTAQIANNMNEKLYEGFVGHYAGGWNAPPPPAATASISPPAAPPSAPTGKPVSGDFPSSASIPPINIMTPEPTDAPPPAASKSGTKDGGNARAQQPPAQDQPPAAPKKQSSQKSKAAAPVPLAPPEATEEN